MAGTIPGLLRRIPVRYATEMRADSGALMQFAMGVPVCSDLFKSVPDHPARPRCKFVRLIDFSPRGIVAVLPQH